MNPIVLIHIACATIALLSGFMAMAVRKGSGLHGAAGTIFFVSMIGMTTSAAYGAMFIKPVHVNFVMALLTLYLVVTAWVAAKRREKKTGAVDIAALAGVVIVAAVAISWGIVIVAVIAGLFAASDVRVLKRGGVEGSQRITRHLWRMSLSLLIALLSLYPGQARLGFPKTPLLLAPHLFVLGMVVFWMLRIRNRNRRTTWNRQTEPPALQAPSIFPSSSSHPSRSSMSRAS